MSKKQVVLDFAGGGSRAEITPEGALEGHSNYYFGSDPRRWIENVPQFRRVRYRDVYPGVDVVWYGNGQQLEYDLELQPGVNPAKIRLRFAGADSVSIVSNGDVVVKMGDQELRQLRPTVWQQHGKGRVRVEADYRMLARNEVGVRVTKRDRSLALAIDPVLSYSTFLGGSGSTSPTSIAVDSDGDAYVTGNTSSADFPGTSGRGNAFVAKLNPAGTAIAWAAYFGATSGTVLVASGIAVDGSGNAFVTGWTNGIGLPVTEGTLKSTKPILDGDAFVIKFGLAGQILWGTYLGGTGSDAGNAITVDGAGNSYVTGYTSSTDFPGTTGGCTTDQAFFVAGINPSGTALLNAICIGSHAYDVVGAIALDSHASVYVAGSTYSTNPTNLPTTPGALQTASKGSQDAFVAKVTSGSLSYLTYLGGALQDSATAIAVDSAGNAYVGGNTRIQ